MWTCEIRHPPRSSKQYKLHDRQVKADGNADNDGDDFYGNDEYICTSDLFLFSRAAHIAVLDSELFIEKFLVIAVLKYFQWYPGRVKTHDHPRVRSKDHRNGLSLVVLKYFQWSSGSRASTKDQGSGSSFVVLEYFQWSPSILSMGKYLHKIEIFVSLKDLTNADKYRNHLAENDRIWNTP